MRPRASTLATVVGVGALCLALAACGSRLDPDEVVAQGGSDPALSNPDASGTAPGAGQGGTDPGTGSGTDPGTAPGTNPGTNPGNGNGGDPGDNGGDDGANAPGGDDEAAPCTGFKNQTGITGSTIKIANISDLSGPIPGLFEAAQDATRAYAAYFNSGSDICGRKLEVLALDSRTDAGGDQQAYAKACEEAFAAVGSMSAFDMGGASTAAACGLPDIRSSSTNPERRDCSTCFAAQSVSPNLVPSVVPKYFLSKYKRATQAAAMLYINAGSATVNMKSFSKAYQMNGVKVVYEQGIDVAEFNYAPYVQQMKDKDVEFVQFMGAYQQAVRLKQAMKQQGFEPEVFLLDATAYDKRYVAQAGDDAEGTRVFMASEMFERTDVKEMALYLSWLQQVKPGATPNFFGLFAWSAARLFVERSIALGGKLDRKSLVAATAKVKDWTANGLHSSMPVGAKSSGQCTKVIRYDGGKWVQESSGGYQCGPLTNSGIGG